MPNRDYESDIGRIRSEGKQAADVLNAPRAAATRDSKPIGQFTPEQMDQRKADALRKTAGALAVAPWVNRKMETPFGTINQSVAESVLTSVAFNSLSGSLTAMSNFGDQTKAILEGLPGPYDKNPDQAMEDMTNVAMDFTGGNLAANMVKKGPVAGLARTDPSVHSIFGTRGVTNDAISRVKELQSQGMTPPEIWERTGVWEYRPGKFIKEYDSSMIALKKDPKLDNRKQGTIEGMVGDIFKDHPLFEDYPGLKGVQVHVKIDGDGPYFSETGAYNGQYITGMAHSLDDAYALIIHEMQHDIQERSNLPRGGSPINPRNMSIFESHKREATRVEYDKLETMIRDTAPDVYRNIKRVTSLTRNPSGPDWAPETVEAIKIAADNIMKRLGTKRGQEVLTQIEKLNKVQEMSFPGGDPASGLSPDQVFYNRLSGEVMARLAARRKDLSPRARKRLFPGYDEAARKSVRPEVHDMVEDVPLERQIDSYDSGIVTANQPPKGPFPIEEALSKRLNEIDDKLRTHSGTYKERQVLMDERKDVQNNLMMAIQERNTKLGLRGKKTMLNDEGVPKGDKLEGPIPVNDIATSDFNTLAGELKERLLQQRRDAVKGKRDVTLDARIRQLKDAIDPDGKAIKIGHNTRPYKGTREAKADRLNQVDAALQENPNMSWEDLASKVLGRNDYSAVNLVRQDYYKLRGQGKEFNRTRYMKSDEGIPPDDVLLGPTTKQLDELSQRRMQKNASNDNASPQETGMTRQEMMSSEEAPPITNKDLQRTYSEFSDEVNKAARQLDVRKKYYLNDESDLPMNDTRMRSKIKTDLRSSDPILWKRVKDIESKTGAEDYDPFEGLALQINNSFVGRDPVHNIKQKIAMYRRWANDGDETMVNRKTMGTIADFFQWAYDNYYKDK